MRVLLVNMTLDRELGGGTAEKAVQTARALARAGESVTVLACGQKPEERFEDLPGIRVVTVPLLVRRFWIPAPAFSRIRRAVAGCDIMLIANHWTILNLLAARAARTEDKPYVVVPSGALAIFGRSRILKRLYNSIGGKRLVADAAAQVATTTLESEHFIGYGVDDSRVVVIPNAIELGSPRPTKGEFRITHDLGEAPYILFIGRLNPIKGPDILLEAFVTIADRLHHHLVFAGPDEGMKDPLHSRMKEADLLDRVHFVGFLAGEMKNEAIHEAALVVIPSREEAMSIVVLEAGAAGRPVVLTDRCGLDDAAKAGVVVTTPPDAGELAKGILSVLESDDQGRALGANLKDYIAANYTWDAVVERYQGLFRRILAK